MVRPGSFRLNEQTAVNNYYQKSKSTDDMSQITQAALNEFDQLVGILRQHEIEVTVIDDVPDLITPDSLFPNNWLSFHEDGRAVTYPMFAPNRRLERRNDVFDLISLQRNKPTIQLDFTQWENQGKFLEGTGSLVLDRVNCVAYAAISPRTDADLVGDWCSRMGFQPILFHASQDVQSRRELIYHTNVMMSIGNQFAVVCLDCIDDLKEREAVASALVLSGRKMLEISEMQVNEFAGNMLEISNIHGKPFVVMSERAFRSLDESLLKELSAYAQILNSPLETIERLGGGSARCMMAEIF